MELVLEILTWLNSIPLKVDIYKYVSHLSDENLRIILDVTTLFEDKLLQEKEKYLEEIDQESFSKNTDEFEQINLIETISKGDSALTIKFPSGQLIPESFYEWRIVYLQKWTALITFASAHEFNKQNQLTNLYFGIENNNLDIPSLSSLSLELYKKESTLYESLEPIGLALSESEKRFFAQTGMFSVTYIDDLFDEDRNVERSILLFRCQVLFSTLELLGEDRKNKDVVVTTLQRRQYLLTEESLLIEAETKRLSKLVQYDPRIRSGLQSMFAIENLNSGNTLNLIRDYLSKLSPNQKVSFSTYVYPFLKNSFIIRISLDPVDVIELIRILGATPSEEIGKQRISTLLEGLEFISDSRRLALQNLMDVINYLVHTLPIAEYV